MSKVLRASGVRASTTAGDDVDAGEGVPTTIHAWINSLAARLRSTSLALAIVFLSFALVWCQCYVLMLAVVESNAPKCMQVARSLS